MPLLPSRCVSRRLLAPIAALALVAACSDDDPGSIPGIPYDTNGDGIVDGAPGECPGATFSIHPDADGDGLGTADAELEACRTYAGWVDNADDCDDTDADVTTAPTWYGDADGDGLGDPTVTATGCEPPPGFVADGTDPHPNCAESLVDDCGVCGGPGASTWYADVDGDGVGDERTAVETCAQPTGFVATFGDPEPECATDDTDSCGVCGGNDEGVDCAGVCGGDAVEDACGVCNGDGERAWFLDADDDGLGAGAATVACEAPGADYVDVDGDPEPDCPTNDTDSCGVCAGPGPALWYADLDDDGLGDPDAVTAGCGAPLDHVNNADDPEPDCPTNDTDSCGVCAGPGGGVWYADVDEDGVGDARVAVTACTAPDGFVATAGDPEPECATDDTDSCGVCAGGDADLDCAGVCFGTAAVDGCGRCAGGATAIPPATEDLDGDTVPDLCDLCDGVDVARTIIQWDGMLPYSGEHGPYTFQVVLYDNGEFRYQYRDVSNWGASATVGYQTAAGVRAVTLANGSSFPTDHPVVHFRALEDGGVAVEYTVAMTWVDIAASGDAYELEDDGEVEIAIGFPFEFFGVDYPTATVTANGILGFSAPFGGYQNGALPDGALGAMLAPMWDDFNPTRGGVVYVQHLPAGCELDCAGMRGGSAFVDECGVCVGGTTDAEPDSGRDCAGVCGGAAQIDVCGVCYGGTTGVEESTEEDCPRVPDLVVDSEYLSSTFSIEYMTVAEGDCLIAEGCVRGSGERKLLRFGTRIGNVGTADLVLGTPPSSGVSTDVWHWDACHGHHHFEEYAAYDLFDVEADAMIPIGSKTGFCVMDIGVYDTDITRSCRGYNCGNQGITAGCQDTYSPSLQCQWIDITDIDDGVYDVIVTTNPDGLLDELDTTNNSASARVRITGDTVQLVTEP